MASRFRRMTKSEVKQFDRLMAKAIREGRAKFFGPGSRKRRAASKKKSGKITYAGRKKMAPGKFVFPKGTKAAPGEKKFPIHDAKHARQALSRAAQPRTKLTGAERCKVVREVCKRYPDVGICGGRSKSRRLARCER